MKISLDNDKGGWYFENAAIAILSVTGLAILGTAGGFGTNRPIFLWLGSGLAAGCFVLTSVVLDWRRVKTFKYLRALSALIVCIDVALTVVGAHRLSILPIALAQTVMIFSASVVLRSWVSVTIMLLAASFAWSMDLAIMWQPFDDFVLSASHSSPLAAIGFVISLVAISIWAFDDKPFAMKARKSIAPLLIAAIIFAIFSLQTRNMYSDWIPYHRSYFVGPATLVRDGHWLLWDVPSQYGFLSILMLAVFPGTTRWDALYLMTALSVTTQAMILFWLFQLGNVTRLAMVTALIVTLSIFFGSEAARYPFNPLIYPQQGLRFIWLLGLEAIMYASYVKRDDVQIRRFLKAAGWCVWLVSVLWSFEVGVWSTFAWFIYCAAISGQRIWLSSERWLVALVELIKVIVPLLVLLAAACWTLEAFYRFGLGHGPDFLAFIELSLSYAGGKVQIMQANPYGTGLTLVALLGGLATLVTLVYRSGSYEAMPAAIGSSAAAWIAEVYYVGEPTFNVHVNMIVPNIAAAFAILVAILRERAMFGLSAKLALLTIVPVYVLFLASFLANPVRSIPFLTSPRLSYNSELAALFPPVSGDIAILLKRSGVKPTDKILFPHYNNGVKLGQGVIMPFVRFGTKVVEMEPWAPLAPVGEENTMLTLSPARYDVFLNRFLALEGHRGGWLVAYKSRVDCRKIDPSLVPIDNRSSGEYSIARCVPSRTREKRRS